MKNSYVVRQLNSVEVIGRFAFTKKFRKFRLGCKWNTRFWFVPLDIFRNKWNFPVGNFPMEMCVPFTTFERSYHFQAIHGHIF